MKYTIAIPAYKKQFLHLCIESILNQTVPDFEIVIVDDCSPENLLEIVNGFKDTRIKYYRNDKNVGIERVTDNWNKCLDYASGSFIICMGDDDMLAPEALAEYDRLIEKYPQLDAFHSRSIIVDEDNKPVVISNDRAERESLPSFMRHRLSGERAFIGDYCFRVSKLKEVGGYYYLPSAWFSDEITSYLCAAPSGIAHTNLPTFLYRASSITITNSGNTTLKLQAWQQYKEWLYRFAQKQCLTTNVTEELEWRAVLNIIPQSLSKAQCWDLINDMRGNHSRVFKWALQCGKYHISRANLLKAFFKSYRV